jgi:hypothetical protein
MADYNISQFTQADLEGAQIVQREIIVGGETRTAEYYIITNSMLKHVSPGVGVPAKITKLGYCTNDNESMNYPIFLYLNGETTPTTFYIGKTGMFEFQDEEWKDVNDEEQEETETMSVYVTQLEVPKKEGFRFCLDYCYSV